MFPSAVSYIFSKKNKIKKSLDGSLTIMTVSFFSTNANSMKSLCIMCVTNLHPLLPLFFNWHVVDTGSQALHENEFVVLKFDV